MPSKGITLFNSSFVGSSAAQSQFWDGGFSALTVNGSVYGANALQLQMQGPSGAWINIGSSIISDQVFPFNAPPGQYRMICQVSSAIGINAVLTTIPYM